jgi:HAD superfamily hydrolase (TIGR01509 family)
MSKIKDIELAAMKEQKPRDGLVEIMDYLESRGVRKAILTRNFDLPVIHLLSKFLPTHEKKFDPILTRHFLPPKPDPAGLLHIAGQWGLSSAENLIMVGDSMDDLLAGYRAGSATCLAAWDGNEVELGSLPEAGIWVKRLPDLIHILENGFSQG